MSKQKGSKLLNLSKFLHRYYNIFFIILFIISLLLFRCIYLTHTNNVEKRFDNALKSYEQSLSNIFNNLSTNNYTNESIVPNISSSCTRDRISINNNNIMNMSEGDSFDELKKSFEIGLDLLKASLSEIMKNSNDVLTFWFAFLSVIMVVFTFAGILINNNVLEQSKYQLTILKKEIDIKKDEIEKEFNNFKKEQFVKIDDDIKIKLQNIKAEVLDYVTSIKNEYNKEFEAQSKKLNDDVANILEDNKTIVEKEHNDLIQRLKSKSNELEKKYNDAIENISLKSDYEYNKYIRISQLFNLGEDSGRNKDYDSVIKYNLEIIALYGDINDVKDKNHINNYAGALYNIGTAKYELKIYDESIEYLNKAIELNPYDSKAYNNLGLAYYAIKEYDKSLNYFNYSLSLNNKDSKTYNNRGTCKEKLKDYKGAIEDYNEAIKLNPNLSEAYNNRGNTQRILNNINSSIRDFDKAIELNPNNSEAYNNRGLVKQQLKDYKGAIEDYNKAIDLNPNKAEFYNNIGLLIKDLNRLNEALSYFDKAIELNPNYSEAYSNRGLLKLQIGILDNVIGDFDKAIEFNPNYSEAYFNRYIAKSLLLTKIVDKNSEEYKKAFDDAYNDLYTAYNLADEQLKVMIKNQVIGMAMSGNEVAIKFCEDKGWI